MNRIGQSITAVFFLFAFNDALACSCAYDAAVTERERVTKLYESSELVGVFEVVGHRRSATIGGEKLRGRFALLRPQHVFKGTAFGGQEFYAQLGGTNTSCEISVENGESLLVYAIRSEPIDIGFCGASKSLVRSLRDLRYLFEIVEPLGGEQK